MLALLQFDSSSLPVVERMLEQDRLPNLADLRSRGDWRPLVPPSPLFQSATYPSLYTGIEVGEHGLYSAFPWSAGDQRIRFMHRFPKPATIWDRLTGAGLSSLVMDPYQCWAPRTINGAYVGGWQFQDRMVMQRRSVPRHQALRLSRRHGRSPELSDVYGRPSTSALLALRESLLAAPGRAADAACDLLDRREFDLVWINFSAAHKAGHHLWDPASVLEDQPGPDQLSALETGLEDVYAQVDAALGRIVDSLPSDAELIVFSPIGMGPNTSRADLLPEMVAAVVDPHKGRVGSGNGASASTPVWGLRDRVPVRLRSLAARALPDRVVADVTTRLYVRANWKRTRAMAIPGECHGYVRLNLAGRERDGIVEPEAADALMAEIADGLMSFREPDGSPAIEEIERTKELVGTCSCAAELPDLVIRWVDRPAMEVGTLTSARYGEVRRGGVGSGRSGHHNDDAWALIVSDRSRAPDHDRATDLTDIGATVCASLGVDSEGLTGRSLLEPGAPRR